MADGRDLQSALEESMLRISAVEERPVLNAFTNIEKRIADFLSRAESVSEAREPYEFM